MISFCVLTSHPVFPSPTPHELNSFAARILELIRSPGVSDLCWIPKKQNPEKVRILAT